MSFLRSFVCSEGTMPNASSVARSEAVVCATAQMPQMREVIPAASVCFLPRSMTSKKRGDSTMSNRASCTWPSFTCTNMFPWPSTRVTLLTFISRFLMRLFPVAVELPKLREYIVHVHPVFHEYPPVRLDERLAHKPAAAAAARAVRGAYRAAARPGHRAEAGEAALEDAYVLGHPALVADRVVRDVRPFAQQRGADYLDELALVHRAAVEVV